MATMLQLAAYLHSNGKTFRDKLNEIYQTYGFHYSLNSYYLCYDNNKIEQIFNRMSNIDGPNSVSVKFFLFCSIFFIDDYLPNSISNKSMESK